MPVSQHHSVLTNIITNYAIIHYTYLVEHDEKATAPREYHSIRYFMSEQHLTWVIMLFVEISIILMYLFAQQIWRSESK